MLLCDFVLWFQMPVPFLFCCQACLFISNLDSNPLSNRIFMSIPTGSYLIVAGPGVFCLAFLPLDLLPYRSGASITATFSSPFLNIVSSLISAAQTLERVLSYTNPVPYNIPVHTLDSAAPQFTTLSASTFALDSSVFQRRQCAPPLSTDNGLGGGRGFLRR